LICQAHAFQHRLRIPFWDWSQINKQVDYIFENHFYDSKKLNLHYDYFTTAFENRMTSKYNDNVFYIIVITSAVLLFIAMLIYCCTHRNNPKERNTVERYRGLCHKHKPFFQEENVHLIQAKNEPNIVMTGITSVLSAIRGNTTEMQMLTSPVDEILLDVSQVASVQNEVSGTGISSYGMHIIGLSRCGECIRQDHIVNESVRLLVFRGIKCRKCIMKCLTDRTENENVLIRRCNGCIANQAAQEAQSEHVVNITNDELIIRESEHNETII